MFHMHYIMDMANWATAHYNDFTNYCTQFMAQMDALMFKSTDGQDDHQ